MGGRRSSGVGVPPGSPVPSGALQAAALDKENTPVKQVAGANRRLSVSGRTPGRTPTSILKKRSALAEVLDKEARNAKRPRHSLGQRRVSFAPDPELNTVHVYEKEDYQPSPSPRRSPADVATKWPHAASLPGLGALPSPDAAPSALNVAAARGRRSTIGRRVSFGLSPTPRGAPAHTMGDITLGLPSLANIAEDDERDASPPRAAPRAPTPMRRAPRPDDSDEGEDARSGGAPGPGDITAALPMLADLVDDDWNEMAGPGSSPGAPAQQLPTSPDWHAMDNITAALPSFADLVDDDHEGGTGRLPSVPEEHPALAPSSPVAADAVAGPASAEAAQGRWDVTAALPPMSAIVAEDEEAEREEAAAPAPSPTWAGMASAHDDDNDSGLDLLGLTGRASDFLDDAEDEEEGDCTGDLLADDDGSGDDGTDDPRQSPQDAAGATPRTPSDATTTTSSERPPAAAKDAAPAPQATPEATVQDASPSTPAADAAVEDAAHTAAPPAPTPIDIELAAAPASTTPSPASAAAPVADFVVSPSGDVVMASPDEAPAPLSTTVPDSGAAAGTPAGGTPRAEAACNSPAAQDTAPASAAAPQATPSDAPASVEARTAASPSPAASPAPEIVAAPSPLAAAAAASSPEPCAAGQAGTPLVAASNSPPPPPRPETSPAAPAAAEEELCGDNDATAAPAEVPAASPSPMREPTSFVPAPAAVGDESGADAGGTPGAHIASESPSAVAAPTPMSAAPTPSLSPTAEDTPDERAAPAASDAEAGTPAGDINAAPSTLVALAEETVCAQGSAEEDGAAMAEDEPRPSDEPAPPRAETPQVAVDAPSPAPTPASVSASPAAPPAEPASTPQPSSPVSAVQEDAGAPESADRALPQAADASTPLPSPARTPEAAPAVSPPLSASAGGFDFAAALVHSQQRRRPAFSLGGVMTPHESDVTASTPSLTPALGGAAATGGALTGGAATGSDLGTSGPPARPSADSLLAPDATASDAGDDSSDLRRRWGFVPGAEDTLNIDVMRAGRDMMGDMTFQAVYGSTGPTARGPERPSLAPGRPSLLGVDMTIHEEPAASPAAPSEARDSPRPVADSPSLEAGPAPAVSPADISLSPGAPGGARPSSIGLGQDDMDDTLGAPAGGRNKRRLTFALLEDDDEEEEAALDAARADAARRQTAGTAGGLTAQLLATDTVRQGGAAPPGDASGTAAGPSTTTLLRTTPTSLDADADDLLDDTEGPPSPALCAPPQSPQRSPARALPPSPSQLAKMLQSVASAERQGAPAAGPAAATPPPSLPRRSPPIGSAAAAARSTVPPSSARRPPVCPPSTSRTSARRFSALPSPLVPVHIRESAAAVDGNPEAPRVYQLTLQDFLREADVQFLDHLRRGASIGLGELAQDPPPANLAECYDLMCLRRTEVAQLEENIALLQRELAARRERIGDKEGVLARENPAVFSEIQLASGAALDDLRAQVALLKQVCRDQARLSWKEWRVRTERKVRAKLEAHAAELQGDLSYLTQSVGALKEVRSAVDDLAARRRGEMAEEIASRAAEERRRNELLATQRELQATTEANVERRRALEAAQARVAELRDRAAATASEREALLLRIAQAQQQERNAGGARDGGGDAAGGAAHAVALREQQARAVHAGLVVEATMAAQGFQLKALDVGAHRPLSLTVCLGPLFELHATIQRAGATSLHRGVVSIAPDAAAAVGGRHLPLAVRLAFPDACSAAGARGTVVDPQRLVEWTVSSPECTRLAIQGLLPRLTAVAALVAELETAPLTVPGLVGARSVPERAAIAVDVLHLASESSVCVEVALPGGVEAGRVGGVRATVSYTARPDVVEGAVLEAVAAEVAPGGEFVKRLAEAVLGYMRRSCA